MLHAQGKGQQAEEMAAQFLKSQGLTELARNYRTQGGEIDLVMQHGGELVFVEVRYRKNARFGGAAVSVTLKKQHRLSLAAAHYLQRHHQTLPCRFDIVAFDGDRTPVWIQNAFNES